MKKYFIFLLILVILVFVTLVLTKRYQNPQVPFSFIYPSNWSLCEELYPNLDEYFVHISDKTIDCSNIAFDKNVKYAVTMSVNTTKRTENTDIKVWISDFEKEVEDMRRNETAKGLIPSTGVQSWSFVNYKDDLLIKRKARTVAEVKNFYDTTEYLVLSNGGYVYQIKAIPNPANSLVVRLILKSIKLSL